MRFRGTFTAPLVVIVVMFLVGASRFLDLAALSFHENICLAVIVIEFVTIVVPTVFYARLRGDRFVSRMRLRAFGPDKLFVIILAAVTLFFADVLLKLGLHAVGAVSENYSIYTYYFRGTGETVDFVYSLITFVVIPSVSEELLFRGVLIPEYEDNGAVTAVVATSLLYGMFGMSFGYFPVYFLQGLFFGTVTYLARSVFASMLCHFVFSSVWLVFGETVWRIIEKPQSTAFLVVALGGIFLVAMSSLLSECERIYYNYSTAGRESDYAKECPRFSPAKFAEALFAPPFPAAALVFAAAAVHFG